MNGPLCFPDMNQRLPGERGCCGVCMYVCMYVSMYACSHKYDIFKGRGAQGQIEV